MNRILIIVLSALVLASCSKSLDLQLEPEVKVFLSKDSKQTIRLTPKDNEYVILKEWLHEHSSDWHITSGRYPGGIFIQSGNRGFQITDTQVVLYSMTSPKPRAIYIQRIDKDELSELKNIGK